jgi:hypothetical protein
MTYRNRDGDCVRAMPSARATHASHRARILGLGLSVGIAIALGGCNVKPSPPQPATEGLPFTANLYAHTDPKSGCEYLVLFEGYAKLQYAAITPRLNADGKANCPATSKAGDAQ